MNNDIRKELYFSFVLLLVYLFLLSISNEIGDLVIVIGFSILIFGYIKKRGLLSYYGFNSLKDLDYKKCMYFIPMILIVLSNLIFGININYSLGETILLVITMLGVGFFEEVMFRGLIFKAFLKKGPVVAIVVSSILFSSMHLVNIHSMGVTYTLIQVLCATFIGGMCSIFVYKLNNIIPSIAFHSLINITSIFGIYDLDLKSLINQSSIMILLSIVYSIFIWKYESRKKSIK